MLQTMFAVVKVPHAINYGRYDYAFAWVTTFPVHATLPWHRHEADRIIICHEDGILIKTDSTGGVESLVFPKDTPTWYDACLPGTLHKDDNPKPYPLHFTIIQFKPEVLSRELESFISEESKGSGVLLENQFIAARNVVLEAQSTFPPRVTPYDRVIIADHDCTLVQESSEGVLNPINLKKRIPLWIDADDLTQPYSTTNVGDDDVTLTVIAFKPGAIIKASPEAGAQALTMATEEELRGLSDL